MNPIPLKDYKEQAYDYRISGDVDNNSLKLRFKSRRLSAPTVLNSEISQLRPIRASKRKASEVESSLNKKNKMSTTEISEMLKGQSDFLCKMIDKKNDVQSENLSRIMNEKNEELKQSFQSELGNVAKGLDELKSKCSQIEDMNTQRDEKIDFIEQELKKFKENMKA